jgi:hypothetical protein
MKLHHAVLSISYLGISVCPSPVEKRQSSGDGPFGPAGWITDPSLPEHTIYRPENPGESPLPVLVWGNGACSANGTQVAGFLSQIASYGFIAIASGSPDGRGSTTAEQMTQSVSWAASGANGLFNVDTSRIMAAGYSCGGIEAYEMNGNDQVSTLGIFNSGLLQNPEFARTITKPILFALGGPGDIAYANGERDYTNLPASLPTWKGNINAVGHGGTYFEPNGGLFAEAAVNWLSWLFKGDVEAGAYFKNGAAVSAGWDDAVSRNVDGLTVPINA